MPSITFTLPRTIKTTCNACGLLGEDVSEFPLEGFRALPAICLGCGHIFIPVADGMGLSLTADEKRRLRELDAAQGNHIQRSHEEIVRQWWG